MTIIDAGPDLEFYGFPKATKPVSERYCPCGTRMSMHNRGERCYACEERDRVPAVQITAKNTRTERLAAAKVNRHLQIVEILRPLPQPFSTQDVADIMACSLTHASNNIKRLADSGMVVLVDRIKVKRGIQTRQMALWTLTQPPRTPADGGRGC